MTAVFDVVVNTDDLVVLGPPDVINVSVSRGEQGPRGSTFYAGAGDPNDSVVSENVFGSAITPIEGDVYINAATGSEYGWLYVYNPKVTGDQWDQVLRLQPPVFARTVNQSFTNGIGTISIPISDIIPSTITGLTADNYIVTMTAVSTDPTVLTINSKSIVSTNLEIVVEAIKYSSSTWSNVTTATNIAINITVV
jgi:hypothetical protein